MTDYETLSSLGDVVQCERGWAFSLLLSTALIDDRVYFLCSLPVLIAKPNWQHDFPVNVCLGIWGRRDNFISPSHSRNGEMRGGGEGLLVSVADAQ